MPTCANGLAGCGLGSTWTSSEAAPRTSILLAEKNGTFNFCGKNSTVSEVRSACVGLVDTE